MLAGRLLEYFNYKEIPMDFQVLWQKEFPAGSCNRCSFASPVEGRISAYLVEPAGPGPFPALLFGHWGYGTGTEFLPEALLYAESGILSLLVDYPWVRPTPWRRNLVQDFRHPEHDLEVYRHTVIDLRRALDFLQAHPQVEAGKVAYVGHSYGAQWGAILAAIDGRMLTAVLMGGVPRSADIYLKSEDPDIVALRTRIPEGILENYLQVLAVLDAINYVSHAAPISLLFQFATYERYFDLKSMREYAQSASEPKTTLWYPTGHELNDPQAFLDRADWLAKELGVPLGLALRKRISSQSPLAPEG